MNESNLNLLDDSVNIEIFNPSSIDYLSLVKEIKEYWNYNYNLYRLCLNDFKNLIAFFERLSFKDKKNILVKLFLILEHDELLPDNIDYYEIVKRIIKY